MFLLNGQPLATGIPFEVNGTQYPANWLNLTSLAEKEAIGITEVADPESYDERFYWGPNNPKLLNDTPVVDEHGSPVYIQRFDQTANNGQGGMVNTTTQAVQTGLKTLWTSQVKTTANILLNKTDWQVVRKTERNIAIDPAVVTYRAAVVTEVERLKTAIAGCADVPALITVVTSQNWPVEA